MSTRAVQIDLLLAPVLDTSGNIVSSGTVYFYAAGTSNTKNVWTEKEKTNAYTSYALSAGGTVQLYGDGIYKIVVKDSDASTVYTWDNVKLIANNFSLVSKTANYTATPDDDVILVDTTGGGITIALETVANFSFPVIIKNIGANDVTIDPDGSEQIDGASTVTIGSQNVTIALYPDTGSSTWRKASTSVAIVDADGDTQVQVEESADEDTIRFDAAGTEQATITDGAMAFATTCSLTAAWFKGFLLRSTLKWKDADEIYLAAGKYHHDGTTEQVLYWANTGDGLTFQFGSGGSNAGSEDLGADEWHYLYFDDSAIVTAGTNLITEARILNSTEEPVWNGAKGGWYPSSAGTYVQTTDRCFGAVLTDGSNNVLEFYNSSDLVLFSDHYESRAMADLDDSWVEVVMDIPSFARIAQATFKQNASGDADAVELRWRTKGQSGTTGHEVAITDNDNARIAISPTTVITNNNQKIEMPHLAVRGSPSKSFY